MASTIFALIYVSLFIMTILFWILQNPFHTIFGTIYSKFSVTAFSSFLLPEILSSYK